MTLEPWAEREAFGAETCRGRIALAVCDHSANGVGEGLWGGRLVPLPALGMRNADAGLVADELDRAAARGVDHR